MLYIYRLSILLLVVGMASQVSAMQNMLAGHASPYLAMHGDDPVKWQEWDSKTVKLAKKQNKLLFVSSGYFSCHWCHVMQRESYKNKDVADLLNKHFIPVKVDRELLPALDAHLIDFVERTQGAAGWPLNVFITPEGYPLVGMTYVPTDNFKKILEVLNKQWEQESENMKKLARAASIELSSANQSPPANLTNDLASGMMDVFVNQSFINSDDLQGGYGQENKFPNVPKLSLLLEIYRLKPNEQIKDFLVTTLNHMASQGLWDQLGGGFYRYTVDPGWQVPHFEKMLYDNALLARLYSRAAIVLKQPDYSRIASQTLDFILKEMDTRHAAYAASLSAVDDKGIEGGYYLWADSQLKKILSPVEFNVVSEYWGTNGTPDLEDKHHLVQITNTAELARSVKRSEKEVNDILQSAKNKMLKVRQKRILPKDEKILTSWNGLTLSAFAENATKDQRYNKAAQQLTRFIHDRLWDKKTKTLYKAIGKTGSLGDGALEDYAYVAEGLLNWWLKSRNNSDKQLLEEIISQAWKRFYTEQGWILAENMLLKYGSGMAMVSDGPMPSASSVLIETTYNFAELTSNQKLKSQALAALKLGHQDLESYAFYNASQIKTIMQVQK